ncbi:MAG TPA: DUF4386 domain-containing protein [Thermoleophilia bacterium]|nr:DUF4386 domain-containing protein [Thermoleophilia bacterium]
MSTRIATARWTGLFYLGVAVGGIVGFLFVRGQLYAPDDAAKTLANLVDHASLARLGIAADLTVVLTQSLVALWFFKLFRRENGFAAGSIAAFGMANAVTILVATIFSATALVVAGHAALAPSGGQAAVTQLLYRLNAEAWDLGGIFFGLWLIPMGYVVATYQVMPRVLGWILMVGGVLYVISAYLTQLIPDAPTALATGLTAVATVGELWMIGYLLILGIRTSERPSTPKGPAAVA